MNRFIISAVLAALFVSTAYADECVASATMVPNDLIH